MAALALKAPDVGAATGAAAEACGKLPELAATRG